MGKYATYTSLQTVMVGTQFDSATTALATKTIQWAESEVNKHIAKRYNISGSPFDTSTTIPPVIVSLTEQLATGYVWRANSRGSKESNKRAKDMIDGVLENLQALAKYELSILDSAGSLVTEKTNTSFQVLSNTDTYTPTFDEDNPLNWAIDKDKLTDISNGRD